MMIFFVCTLYLVISYISPEGLKLNKILTMLFILTTEWYIYSNSVLLNVWIQFVYIGLFVLLISLNVNKKKMQMQICKSMCSILLFSFFVYTNDHYYSEFILKLQICLLVILLIGVNIYIQVRGNAYIPEKKNELNDITPSLPKTSLGNIQYIWYESNRINCHYQNKNGAQYIIFSSKALRQLSIEQLSALVYHEFGHMKYKHITINFIIKLLQNIIYVLGVFVIVYLYVSGYFHLYQCIYITYLITSMYIILCKLFNHMIFRQQEYAADRYALKYISKDLLISTLLATSDLNYRSIYAYHPSVHNRIKRISSYETTK